MADARSKPERTAASEPSASSERADVRKEPTEKADGEAGKEKRAGLLWKTISEFSGDNCTTMAAALAYYTVFSLPPLLVIVIYVAGQVLDPAQVEQAIQQQAGGLVGQDGAEQIQTMIQSAGSLGDRGAVGLVLGVAGLLFGATGAFAQLQMALNRAWEITADPESGILRTVVKRVLSLGMVLGIAFLLLVSLALSAALSAVSGWAAQLLPGGVSSVALFVSDALVSLMIITFLFAAIFKVLPDAKIAWRDVWMGAFVTALLFVAGKFAIGFYLGQSNPGEAFGAAGSLALILVWVYYSAMIVFLGAEFTQAWAVRRGAAIEPDKSAVRLSDGPVQA